jgi:hypothetical protein
MFRTSGPERVYNRAIRTIADFGDESIIPDLVDNSLGLIWEIKPANADSITLGLSAIWIYQLMLNNYVPRDPPWQLGEQQYVYSDPALGPVIPAPQYGAVAVVFPAVLGIMTYETIKTSGFEYEMQVEIASELSQEEASMGSAGVSGVELGIGAAELGIMEIFPAIQLQPVIGGITAATQAIGTIYTAGMANLQAAAGTATMNAEMGAP